MTILFFLFCWLFIKALKALFRPRKRTPAPRIKTSQETRLSVNMAALDTLQQQREQIENTIDYLQDCINAAETPEKTIQYMDRLQSLYGKLASVQIKINKLTG